MESFFSVIKDNLSKGEPIYVRGFGSFVNKKRAHKIARNISKNTSIEIPEHYIPSFKPAKSFVEQVKSSAK
jgi:DNA-binding protein HU-beta